MGPIESLHFIVQGGGWRDGEGEGSEGGKGKEGREGNGEGVQGWAWYELLKSQRPPLVRDTSSTTRSNVLLLLQILPPTGYHIHIMNL